ncbi:hypothetical protein JVT61DRAFT_6425 [Boletus reticuloceps]|uniref:DNA-directed RNA polymerase n=1 Tax=Boletus reticuloceps TaxID=495285 RepID=A0A8I2YKE6_9AGAM|nr:hypothetical protein JVT61DRAFT_6425 [Boletus reticuloceps]
MVISRGINIHCTPDPKSWNPVFDNGMMVDNDEILFGIVDKKTVSATQGGLIHVVFRKMGPEATIGIGDTIPGPKVMSYITQHIGEKKQQVAEIIDDTYHDQLKPMLGMTIWESFKSKVKRELNHTRDDSDQYTQQNLKEDNNIKQMVTAGLKGSYINISQMSVCVGQQSVEGCHIPFGFRHWSQRRMFWTWFQSKTESRRVNLQMPHSVSCTIPITGLFACRDIICGNFVPNLRLILEQITDLTWNPCNLAQLSMGFFRLGYARVLTKSSKQLNEVRLTYCMFISSPSKSAL